MIIRSERTLKAIRAMPCAFCGAPPPNDPHHAGKKCGMGGGNRLDATLVLLPACRRCHDIYEDDREAGLEKLAERERTYPGAITDAVNWILRLDKDSSRDRIEAALTELFPEASRLARLTLEAAKKL
jgi:hypothetical protein